MNNTKLHGQMGLIVGMIGLVIFVLIALSLTPTVSTQTVVAQANNNVSSASSTLLGLTPLLYVVLIVVAILGYVAVGRR